MLQIEPTYIENKDNTKTEIPPNPFLCLGRNRQDIYYQDGEYYRGRDEEAIAYKDVPRWFWVDLKKCYTPEIIAKWGIELPTQRSESIGESKPAKKAGRPKRTERKIEKKPEILQETATV